MNNYQWHSGSGPSLADFHVSSAGKWSAKVCDKWLDKWNEKRRCYEVVEFRSKQAAEKAAAAKLALYKGALI